MTGHESGEQEPEKPGSVLVTVTGDLHIHLWTQAHHSNPVRTVCGITDGKTYTAAKGFVLDCPMCWRIVEACRADDVTAMMRALDECVPEALR